MALRPPVPTSGKSFDAAYGYQMKAGCAGGSTFKPVLFLEVLTGFAGSNAGPLLPVA
jgi:hypothetical protein